jgi:RecA-family ATPase
MTVKVIELNHDQKRHRAHRRKIAPLRPSTQVELLSADTIHPEPIQWLWEGWMASGKLHILAGPPGTGKTTVATAFAAILSKGGIWPDGTSAPSGNVLIWSGEDDPKDTLVPRLIASGGDLTRVFFVGDVVDHGMKRCFDPAIHMEPLMEAIQQIGGIRLLVIDPIVSVVQGDSHKNVEVRRGLQPLVQFGNEIGCAVLGITHFSKGTGGKDPVERISGSIAFGALARIVYVTAKLSKEDQQQGGSRIICRSKSNIGPDEGGYRYD